LRKPEDRKTNSIAKTVSLSDYTQADEEEVFNENDTGTPAAEVSQKLKTRTVGQEMSRICPLMMFHLNLGMWKMQYQKQE